MGTVYAEITLKNAVDVVNAQRGVIGEAQIRTATVNAMVDTGAGTLVINEELRQRLGLEVRRLLEVTLADNTKAVCKRVEPVEVHWKDREMSCQPLVVSEGEVLLGLIPLEDMDLMVDPTRQQLTGAHGEKILSRI